MLKVKPLDSPLTSLRQSKQKLSRMGSFTRSNINKKQAYLLSVQSPDRSTKKSTRNNWIPHDENLVMSKPRGKSRKKVGQVNPLLIKTMEKFKKKIEQFSRDQFLKQREWENEKK